MDEKAPAVEKEEKPAKADKPLTPDDLKSIFAEAVKPLTEELSSLKKENAVLKARVDEGLKTVPGTPAPVKKVDLAEVWAKAIERGL